MLPRLAAAWREIQYGRALENSIIMPNLRGKIVNYRALLDGTPLQLEKKCATAVKYNFTEELYEIERIITKRLNKLTKCIEYLVQWKGYSKYVSTWEPLPTPTAAVYYIPNNYDNLIQFADIFTREIQKNLNGNINTFRIELPLDLFRFLYGDIKKVHIREKSDVKLPIMDDCFFIIRKHDQGRKAVFPFTMEPRLQMRGTGKTVQNNNVIDRPKYPVEQWFIKMAIVACNADNIEN